MAGTRSAVVAVLLLSGMPMLSVESAYGTQPAARSVSVAAPVTGLLRWEPWRADTPVSPAQAELRADLIRHVEATMPVRSVVETFPLTGDLLGERAFWATVVVSESEITTWVVLVFEHRRGRWHEVARHELSYHIPGPVAPVRIEPSNAWMVANGGSGARGAPTWEVLRFDGTALRIEVLDNWVEVMLVDVDGDGTLEVLGGDVSHVYCYYCGMTARSFSLHRWNGVKMAEAALEPLPAGSAAEAAVTANDRAAELAGAGRWAEALAMIDGARALATDSAVFRRNAALIRLNAGAAGDLRLTEDDLLHHVLAGSWAAAVDLFRGAPAGPDLFAEPPYVDEAARLDSPYGTPPFLRAIFDATVAARAVQPARAEIEFLHAWSALHLDSGRTVAALGSRDVEYRVGVDEATLLKTLQRAAALAPGDVFFEEAWRVVADRATR